jgi:hypothetical protein
MKTKTDPLTSVQIRIGEASAALERLTTSPLVDGSYEKESNRYRLLWWLRDLREEERSLIEGEAS